MAETTANGGTREQVIRHDEQIRSLHVKVDRIDRKISDVLDGWKIISIHDVQIQELKEVNDRRRDGCQALHRHVDHPCHKWNYYLAVLMGVAAFAVVIVKLVS